MIVHYRRRRETTQKKRQYNKQATTKNKPRQNKPRCRVLRSFFAGGALLLKTNDHERPQVPTTRSTPIPVSSAHHRPEHDGMRVAIRLLKQLIVK